MAATITLALAGIALAIVVNTLALWRRVRGDAASAVQARLIFDLLERDLHGALCRSDSNPWLAVELQNSPALLRDSHGWLIDVTGNGCMKPATGLSLNAVPAAPGAGIASARFGVGGSWLRFFSLESTGLPAAVSYQLVRRPVAGGAAPANPAARRYLFFRTTSSDALNRGYDVTSGYDDVLTVPGVIDVLSENVVDFGVCLYVRDASAAGGLQRLFPANATDTARYVARGDGTVAQGSRFPEIADVMVRIISDEGATLLANLEDGRGRSRAASDVEWWSLVEAYSKVFVHRIELKGAGQ